MMLAVEKHVRRCLVLALGVLALTIPRVAWCEVRHFIIIVGSGAGAGIGRSDLRFADDDAAKYAALFRRAMPASEIVLASRFDAETLRLYPGLATTAVSPTRATLAEAFTRITARAKELVALGHGAELHFVFAGHGDLEQGRAFLQLEDGRLTGDELARRLRQFPGRSHIILDACNSIFLIQSRRAGGLRSTTPTEAAAALARTLPDTGVLLASGTDGEVFEWATLSGGVFSYVVRSGLVGGADANGDGKLSYRELRAFVTVATRSLPNPKFRPEVFARGPAGDDDAPILTLPPAAMVVPPRRTRLTLEDSSGTRWAETSPEPGFLPRIMIPDRDALLESVATAPRTFSFVQRGGADTVSFTIDSGRPTIEATVAARGSDAVFEGLFAEPFGPRAMERVERARAIEPVYGVSRTDMQRLDGLVREVAGTSRALRLGTGIAGVGTGAAVAVVGAAQAGAATTTRDRFLATVDVSAGLLWIGLQGVLPLANSSAGEVLLHRHEARLSSGMPERLAFARTERELFQLAAHERSSRFQWAAWSFLGAAASVGAITLELGAARNENRPEVSAQILALNLCLASGVYNLFPSSVERLAEVWRRDPERLRFVSATLVPFSAGGPGLGVAGAF